MGNIYSHIRIIRIRLRRFQNSFFGNERVLNDQIEIIGPRKKRRKAGSDDDNGDVDDDDNDDDKNCVINNNYDVDDDDDDDDNVDDDDNDIIDHINSVNVEHVCRVPAIWTPASRLPLGSLRKYKNKRRF